nr:probable ATP-dependent RNA helicase DDX5 [Dermacentor andersoni]
MANLLFVEVVVGAGQQLNLPNGPNEPLPPIPVPGNADLFEIEEHHDFWYRYCMPKGDNYDAARIIARRRGAVTAVGPLHRTGSPNWREMNFQPFERNFYRENFRTAWRSADEMEQYRKENRITVKGRGVQMPLLRFHEANFPACVVEALEANEYNTSSPTPVQAQCWPVALKGRNLLAVIGAGVEGKILAYLLPAIVHVLKQPPLRTHQGFLALVLTPTPEKARHIQRLVGKFESHTSVRANCVCSGGSKDQQLRDLRSGFEICIATPGRIHTFLEAGKLDLARCTYFVLDGVDCMVDMGFEQQILSLAKHVRPDRQTLMWMSRKPKELYRLVDALLKDYVEVNVGECRTSSDQGVEQLVCVCAESEKEARLMALLEDILSRHEDAAVRKVIVYAETKKRVDDLVSKLRLRGWPVVGIHGETTERARDWAVAAFSRGETPVLVATDVAGRELPSDCVRYVVNYDYPSSAEAYARRIGHASRLTGDSCTAYTFLEPGARRCAKEMIGMLRGTKRKVDPELYVLAKKAKAIQLTGDQPR